MPRKAAPLVLSRQRFKNLLRELARRGEGHRESGAFLLYRENASRLNGRIEVTDIAFYDDLDPDSLTGGITFHASGMSRLNQLCRERDLRVAADIHTHPREGVHQSSIDSGHPMVLIPGHIALIAPNFAKQPLSPESLGAHVYQGSGTWISSFGNDVHGIVTTRSGFSLALMRLFARMPQLGGTR